MALAHCRNDVVAWWNDWCWTFDPRAAEEGRSAYMPFDLWPKQEEFLRWLTERVENREEFVVEKSRDVGATYLMAGFAVHRWLFHPGFKTTFGSRRQDYVDELGNPDSIFEKMRIIIRRLPWWMLPAGFNWSKHDLFLRLINPANENIISGEGGDNMGRGGRAALYIIDEAAHIERADRVEAAVIAVSDCRGYVSSVNGQGNMFARKRFGGKVPVFTFHWTDDPRKTPEWAAKKKADTDAVIWAQEYEIDYSASVEGICIPAKHVQAALKLADLTEVKLVGKGVAGMDVGGGKAKSVFTGRKGPLVFPPVAWGDPDTIETAHRGLDEAQALGLELLNYDAPGVGIGVTSALRHANRKGLKVRGINTGIAPSNTKWPDGRFSHEMFGNLKAEIWWLMREAFKRTYERVLWELGEEGGVKHPVDECIALPADAHDLVSQLSLVRVFRNEKGKIVLETKDQLQRRGIASPDYADSFALTFVPEGPERRVTKLAGF